MQKSLSLILKRKERINDTQWRSSKSSGKIAKKLEIQNYQASCLPEDKMKTIENLSKNYKVLFVGDGVNDALALKYASVSMTLREGSDLAIESSDVLLLKNDLLSLKSHQII